MKMPSALVVSPRSMRIGFTPNGSAACIARSCWKSSVTSEQFIVCAMLRHCCTSALSLRFVSAALTRINVSISMRSLWFCRLLSISFAPASSVVRSLGRISMS